MGGNQIPQGLPSGGLTDVLAKKAAARTDIPFNLLAKLDGFRLHVSQEVRHINELFPDYTPHDNDYHLKNLFGVAAKVLGSERLEAMNCAELFVLAVALYGHDWGMAMSRDERDFIVTGKAPAGRDPKDFWLLPNERKEFGAYARKQRLPLDANDCLPEVSDADWREYVRQTHAARSGDRVRRFFEKEGLGIGEAAGRVCEGHWLDIEKLQEYERYPPNFSALGETINLRALAVYLRLIDRLDLGGDRTPYVIWKFVAPRDPRSRMEWAKHRALQPVECPQHQDRRCIVVDGSTNDPEVYAGLEDLRIECEKELRGCNEVLARMNDPRHFLDLSHVDWRAAALGFDKVSIRFEFDRTRMFEILSDEIYQGDPYVFLRELLQNSIDAIRVRREVLKHSNLPTDGFGEIRVEVEHQKDGDAVVTWRDNGVGMDQYVVEKYLAVAGKSFYHSQEFQREGLNIDPISRFGVGILSCFMVAERMEIDTFGDRQFHHQAKPLKIAIPAVDRLFRVETGSPEGARVGTTVRVFVEGRKLPRSNEEEAVEPLDVTEYLSIVAGFVEFPIVVTERGRKTIILHPKQDAEAAKKRFGVDEVRQLDIQRYPWSDLFYPQDVPLAQSALEVFRFDIAKDLKVPDYEGVFSFAAPRARVDLLPGGGTEATLIRSGHLGAERIRWGKSDRETGSHITPGSRTASRMVDFAVYRDGVLLADAARPSDLAPSAPTEEEYLKSINSGSLPSFLVVNLPKSDSARLDLARTRFRDQREHWADSIRRAYLAHIRTSAVEKLLALDPLERLYEMGRLVAFHRVKPEELWAVLPHDRWPMPFLKAGGKLEVVNQWRVPGESILAAIGFLAELCSFAFADECFHRPRKLVGLLEAWEGEDTTTSCDYIQARGVDSSLRLCEFSLSQTHCPGLARFLTPPWPWDCPVLQVVWVPKDGPNEALSADTLLRKEMNDPALIGPTERALLAAYDISSLVPSRDRVLDFGPPFEGRLGYAGMWNAKHPLTQALRRVSAAFSLARRENRLSRDETGRIDDTLSRPCLRLPDTSLELWPSVLRDLSSLIRETKLLDIGDLENLAPKAEDFVPGGDRLYDIEQQIRYWLSKVKLNMPFKIRPFGRPLA